MTKGQECRRMQFECEADSLRGHRFKKKLQVLGKTPTDVVSVTSILLDGRNEISTNPFLNLILREEHEKIHS